MDAALHNKDAVLMPCSPVRERPPALVPPSPRQKHRSRRAGQLPGVQVVAGQQLVTLAAAGQHEAKAAVTPGLERPWFERVMSRPPRDIRPWLEPDSCLKVTLQHPEDSLAFYQKELARRETMEKAGEHYTFEPLMASLRNMRLLTQNILDGQQFDQPLSQTDHDAFLELRTYIDRLIAEQAPYERTVRLALLMNCMQEVATARYLLPELRRKTPELFAYCHSVFNHLHPFPCFSAARKAPLKTEDVSLHQLLSCAWGDLNPNGEDEDRILFYDQPIFRQSLSDLLENRRILLYPAFAALDPADFCRIGHVPIFPLGMMTAHALNADGHMLTPLSFFRHDIEHTVSNATWKYLQSPLPLDAPHSRLLFRLRVLDDIPAALEPYRLERALEQVVFYLFHEATVAQVRKKMAAGSVLPLFQAIERIRKEEHLGWPAVYREIPDFQALLACLWVHRLYHHLLAHPDPVAADTRELTAGFVTRELAALHEHWCFMHRHQAALHAYFAARAHVSTPSGGHKLSTYKSRSPWAAHYLCETLILREQYNRHAGGPVDQTHLVYLDALHVPEERVQIAQVLGETPPHKVPF